MQSIQSPDRLIIAGLNTDVCVLETAQGAAQAGFHTSIAVDLCRDPKTLEDTKARTKLLRGLLRGSSIHIIKSKDMKKLMVKAAAAKPATLDW